MAVAGVEAEGGTAQSWQPGGWRGWRGAIMGTPPPPHGDMVQWSMAVSTF